MLKDECSLQPLDFITQLTSHVLEPSPQNWLQQILIHRALLTSVNSTASTPALTFHSAHVLWSLREDTVTVSQSVMCSNSRHAVQVFEEVIRCVSTGQRWSLTHISCDMFMRSQANLKSSSNFKSDYIFECAKWVIIIMANIVKQ